MIFLRIIELPAFVFLGIWIALQMLSQAALSPHALRGGGVAYLAHIGGFAAGILLIVFFSRRRR